MGGIHGDAAIRHQGDDETGRVFRITIKLNVSRVYDERATLLPPLTLSSPKHHTVSSIMPESDSSSPEAERAHAEPHHHAEAARNGAVGHDPHDHVHGFRHQRDKIPKGIMADAACSPRVPVLSEF